MAMKLVEKSEMSIAKGQKTRQRAMEDKRWEIASPMACMTDKTVVILPKDRIIECERRFLGTTSNCTICEGISKEMFDRCKHKWTEY